VNKMTATREEDLRALLESVAAQLAEAHALVADAAELLAHELPDERPEDCTDETTELVQATAERLTLMHLAATAPTPAHLLQALIEAAEAQGVVKVVHDEAEVASALAGMQGAQQGEAHPGMYL
jgi:hypothetical protein